MKFYDVIKGSRRVVLPLLLDFISGMANVSSVVILFEIRQLVNGKNTFKYETKSVDLDAKRRKSTISGCSISFGRDDWIRVLCDQGHLVLLLTSPINDEIGSYNWIVNPIYSSAVIEDNGCMGSVVSLGKDSYDLLLHYPGANSSFYYKAVTFRHLTYILRDLDRMPEDWVVCSHDDIVFLEEKLGIGGNFFFSRGTGVIEIVNSFLKEIGQYTKHAVVIRDNTDDEDVIDFETRRSLHLVPSMKDNMIDVMCPCESSFGRDMFKDWITHPLTDTQTINNRLTTIHRLSLDGDGLYARIDKLDKIISRVKVSTWNYVWRDRPIKDIGYLRKVYCGINNISRMLHRVRHYDFLDADAETMRFTVNRVHTVIWDHWVCEPGAPDDDIFVVHWTTDTIDECIRESLKKIMSTFKSRAVAFNSDLDVSRVRYDTNNTGIFVPNTTVWSMFLDSIGCAVINSHDSRVKVSLPELDEVHDAYLRTYKKFYDLAMEHTTKILSGLRAPNAGVHDFQVSVRRVLRFLGNEEVMLKLALQLREGGLSVPRFHADSQLTFRGINLPNPDNVRVSGRNVLLSTFALYDRANSVDMKSTPITMVTGSTGTGKSLFLRMVGINVVRAMCGMPVYCDSMRLPNFEKIFMHAGISDSLEHGVSSFTREILRVNKILDYGASARMLILTDELFQTTRESTGQVLLTKFINYLNTKCPRAIAVMSTHHMIKPKINRRDVVFDKDHVLSHGLRARYDNIIDILESMDLMDLWDHDPGARVSAKRLRSI